MQDLKAFASAEVMLFAPSRGRDEIGAALRKPMGGSVRPRDVVQLVRHVSETTGRPMDFRVREASRHQRACSNGARASWSAVAEMQGASPCIGDNAVGRGKNAL